MKIKTLMFLLPLMLLGVLSIKAQSQDVGNLDGKDYVDYFLNRGGLVRITNRRTTTSNLTDDGTKTLGVRANVNNLQQVWILEKKGTGYTLRNGSTGRFLSSNDNYRSPSASSKTLYIQYSPNNSRKTSYINISEKSDFSGSTCLNLNGDGVNLYKWTCQGDPGSDWTISDVENFTLEQVQADLLAKSDYVTPEVGKYYRIRNMGYDTYMNEDFGNNALSCEAQSDDKLYLPRRGGISYKTCVLSVISHVRMERSVLSIRHRPVNPLLVFPLREPVMPPICSITSSTTAT